VFGLQRRQPGLYRAQLGLDLLAPLAQGGLVGDLLLQRVAEGGQVVGEQAEPGVAQVGLDPDRPPGDLGLPPSGFNWRRSSVVRSVSRFRLACIASSLRSAFSLRLRCLRTPAASSMNARRSSGLACSTASSWPCPTITCISRPMPESDSSS
jgi:hypothetical protein